LRFGLVLKPRRTPAEDIQPISTLERRDIMRWTMIVMGAALLLGVEPMRAAWAEDPPVDPKAKQFKVQGKFTEATSDNGEKNERTTRVPALFIVEGRRLTFRSGGAAALVADPLIGAAPVSPFGFSLQLTVTRLGGENVLLDMAVDNTQVATDAKLTAAKSVSVHSTRKARVGAPLRIILEEDAKGAPRQWLDLTVVEADE
jgi:hypothetical protein